MTLLIIVLSILQVLPLLVVQKVSESREKPAKIQAKELNVVDNKTLLEAGQSATLRQISAKSELIRVVTYNIRFRSGDDLKKIILAFRHDKDLGSPSIICLQEVDRNKKRSGKTNTAKLLADELGLYYAWAAPPTANSGDEEETGVAILSVYPLTNLQRIVLPNEGPGGRRRVALGATVKIADRDVRIYSAHAETRISMEKKLQQLNSLLEDLAQHAPGTPVMIMGDLNTWQTDAAPKTIKLFSDAGFSTPFGSHKTFSQKVLFLPIEMRLDWVWMRGIEAIDHGIDKEVDVSDHWPLWTTAKLAPAKE